MGLEGFEDGRRCPKAPNGDRREIDDSGAGKLGIGDGRTRFDADQGQEDLPAGWRLVRSL